MLRLVLCLPKHHHHHQRREPTTCHDRLGLDQPCHQRALMVTYRARHSGQNVLCFFLCACRQPGVSVCSSYKQGLRCRTIPGGKCCGTSGGRWFVRLGWQSRIHPARGTRSRLHNTTESRRIVCERTRQIGHSPTSSARASFASCSFTEAVGVPVLTRSPVLGTPRRRGGTGGPFFSNTMIVPPCGMASVVQVS